MKYFSKDEGFETINKLGKKRKPFLFIISFDKKQIFAQALEDLDKNIYYKFQTSQNYTQKPKQKNPSFKLFTKNISFKSYKKAFDKVLDEIRLGNTYLLNLTFATPIETKLSLKEIFDYAKAPFKLYVKGKFTCFSPEKFIEINQNTISTYPMKGTIDASFPKARESLLNNQKELAEHIMIVDLMRNDLAIVGSKVKVEKFRYIEKIKAGEKELLQVSSKITASLKEDWQDNIGSILNKLLPAGSISGTPKKSTISIIENVENYKRGFYTGVFGLYDGKNLNSAVMIRFIEKQKNKLLYKSGGGITIDSNSQEEYEELKAKVYLPF